MRIRFALCLDIVNHYDINILAFHNNWGTNFIINIYLDSNQTALHFLCQNIINLDNTIIMTGDFNIRDSDWDPNFQHYSIHTNDLLTIANSLDLELFLPLNPGSIRFANNLCDFNSVIDLVFLPSNNRRFGQYTLHSDIHKLSDHVLLIIEVGIIETNIDLSTRSIRKDSDEEKSFITALTNGFSYIDSLAIRTKEGLKSLV